MGARSVIQGTRVPVDVVLGQLAAGLTADQVDEEYGLEGTFSPRWPMPPRPSPAKKCETG